MGRLNDFLFRFEEKATLFFCVLMCVIVMAEVAWRALMGTTVMVGVQEFAKWSYIWMVNMACAALCYQKMHMVVEYFMQKFCPKRLQNIIDIITTTLLALSFIAIVTTGFPFAVDQWQLRSTSADIPKTIPFLSVPVAFSLMLIHSIVQITDIIKRMSSSKVSREN